MWSGPRSLAHPGQRFGLSVGGQRVHDLAQIAFHDLVKPIERQTDPMIGEPPLRDVVGTDALAAVA